MPHFTEHDIDYLETLVLDRRSAIELDQTIDEGYRLKRVDELDQLIEKIEELGKQGILWGMDSTKVQTTEAKANLEALREVSNQLAELREAVYNASEEIVIGLRQLQGP